MHKKFVTAFRYPDNQEQSICPSLCRVDPCSRHFPPFVLGWPPGRHLSDNLTRNAAVYMEPTCVPFTRFMALQPLLYIY
ncbi:hypothetical protein XELAEV_18025499mg [Xenopus laevis]|uniref:Uncharacterized protein n=1 Tax=Xenopus laevis TaxID=8355 RepID=A0A974CZT0_XENLA|nr:hypothetical protein XELAEV_18025499mg [Xenopus laevis]